MKEFRFTIEEIIKLSPRHWSYGMPIDAIQITKGYCICDEFGENIKEVLIDKIIVSSDSKDIVLNNNNSNYNNIKKCKENIFPKLIKKILQKDYIDMTKV